MCLVQSRQQKSCEIPWIRNITQKMLKLKGSSWALLGKLLDYNMVDSKTVLSQVQELQVILHEIHAEGMFVSESFQVAAIIEKLPPSWKYFKNYLKHKRKEMRLEDLIVRLRIEEDNRSSERALGNHYMESKANFVEHNKNKRKYSGESSKQGTNGGNFTKFSGKCYVCGKMGHRLRIVISVKNKGPRKALKPTLLKWKIFLKMWMI